MVNVEGSGSIERQVAVESTLCFMTVLELIELLRNRMAQINDVNSPNGSINPRVIERLGESASLQSLLVAEILDPEVEYPLAILRGGVPKRLHHDLQVFPEIVDKIVFHTELGEVSYDDVRDDLKRRPGAQNVSMQRDLEELAKIRRNLARRAV